MTDHNADLLQVGDEVVLTFGRKWQGRNGTTAIIERVGRKWAYFKVGYKEFVVDRATGEGKTDGYGMICRAYRPDAYEVKRKRDALESALHVAIRKAGESLWQRSLSDEQIVTILDALGATGGGR